MYTYFPLQSPCTNRRGHLGTLEYRQSRKPLRLFLWKLDQSPELPRFNVSWSSRAYGVCHNSNCQSSERWNAQELITSEMVPDYSLIYLHPSILGIAYGEAS